MTGAGGDILAWTKDAIDTVATKAEAAKAFGDGFAPGSEAPDYVYGTGDGGPYLRVVIPGFEGQTEAGVEHFAQHSPIAVLRRCAADRKLLELHKPVILRGGSGARYFETTTVCSSCEPPRQFLEHAYPCPTVLTVAEGYGWTEGER
ncbi:DUF6221 family protein [Streptomyces olivaceiscleroticus]|uniref:Uncharacterized protein n=1 Tax=Streptomyces olivaceiscleroticus TaxID=68245 RepID=A0ABN1BLQ1_9ACTN